MAEVTTPPVIPTPPAGEPRSGIHGLKFWQAMLLYPALASALLAAMPTVWNEVKAWRLGVARSQLQLVLEQQRLWESNLACIEKQGTWEVDGPDGLVIKVTLCSTGDVLLRYHQNDWTPHYRWVSRPTLVEKK